MLVGHVFVDLIFCLLPLFTDSRHGHWHGLIHVTGTAFFSLSLSALVKKGPPPALIYCFCLLCACVCLQPETERIFHFFFTVLSFLARSTRPFPVPVRLERPFHCDALFTPHFRSNSERWSQNPSQLGRSGPERPSFESLLGCSCFMCFAGFLAFSPSICPSMAVFWPPPRSFMLCHDHRVKN